MTYITVFKCDFAIVLVKLIKEGLNKMTMKKQDRKAQYCKIINALGKGDNKTAWDEVVSLAADDSGLYIFSSYEDVLKANAIEEVEL